ncbi:unnamed protein product [Mycena citricolor]|uniref:DUF6534 domain-containing protein n=1 Tax=Mycena citricolor TaxID=2018698 RepID=A0AAD2HF92_9AGAR|nr:unnamed protein product [Mycena citricolor]
MRLVVRNEADIEQSMAGFTCGCDYFAGALRREGSEVEILCNPCFLLWDCGHLALGWPCGCECTEVSPHGQADICVCLLDFKASGVAWKCLTPGHPFLFLPTMAPPHIPGINIPFLTGPMVLGYMWTYFLYGVLVVQVYIYSESFPNDRKLMKVVVYSMFFLETIFTIFSTIAAWQMFGDGWGDPNTLLFLPWSFIPLPELNGILASMAQGFYVWRIWTLTKSIWVPIVISMVSLMQMAASFYFGIAVTLGNLSTLKLLQSTSEVTIWLVGSGVCDILITIALVTILARRKGGSQFARTSGALNKLIRFSVETGLITTTGAVVDLILWLSMPHFNWHFIFFLTIGRLYSNVLVATLNARPVLQGGSVVSAMQAHANTSMFNDATSDPKHNISGMNPRVGMPGVRITHASRMEDDRGENIVMADFRNGNKGGLDNRMKLSDDDYNKVPEF